LQKIIFEQAAQSQETEDGFQKIREVTGLTDVMDIVHKFLNRDVEHEQLRVSAREAEAHLIRLHSLREVETNKHSKAHRDQEQFQLRLRDMTLLVDNLMHWARRITRSLSTFEELEEVEGPQDLINFFESLRQTVERFFTLAIRDQSYSKLSKITTQAHNKEYTEQQKLLNDKEFIRANCRVPATLDGGNHHKHGDGHGHTHRGREQDGENVYEQDMAHDRDRLKQESMAHGQEKTRRPTSSTPHDRSEHHGEKHGEECESKRSGTKSASAPRASAVVRPQSSKGNARPVIPPSGARPMSGGRKVVPRKM